MRIGPTEVVADQTDLQIAALVSIGYNTTAAICGVMAPRVTSQFGQALGGISDDTTRRHLKGCVQKGLISELMGTLSATSKGAEILSGLRELPGGIDTAVPPHIGAIVGYSRQISAPRMVLGSLFYLTV